MSFLNVIAELRSRKEPISQEDLAMGFGGDSWTGKSVDRISSMGIAATWAAVRLLSDSVASLPLVYYRRTDRGKEKAVGDPLFALLNRKPNKESTSYSWRETAQHHLLLRGNTYSQLVRDTSGRISEVWLLDAEKVRVERSKNDGQLFYIYRNESTLLRDEVLHIPGLGWDGISGYSPMEIAVQEFGYSIAVKEYGSEFFKNDGTPGGYLGFPAGYKLKDKEAIDRLKHSWNSAHTNWGDKHKIGVLEDGAEFKQTTLPPEHMQFIESQKFSVTDIARIFRVPPHMIGDLSHATFSNIEEQSIDFVTNSLRPWLVRWEQNLNNQIIPENQQDEFFFEFNINGLLRGDFETRAKGYRTFIEMGSMSQNEVRALENFNEVDGGDDYWVPLNWQKIGDDGLDESTEPGFGENSIRMIEDLETRQNRAANSRFKLSNRFRPLFEEVIGRIVRKEARDIRAGIAKFLATRGISDFDLFLDQFYQGMPEFIRKQVTPTYSTFAESVKTEVSREIDIEDGLTAEDEAFIASFVTLFARRYIQKSQKDMQAALNKAVDNGIDPVIEAERQIEHWEEARAGFTAHNEAVRSSNAFAKVFMIAAGVTLLRWVAIGESCPFCDSLNGKVVGVEQDFALPNDVIEAGGKGLNVQSKVGHPPIHRGCDCQIVAGG